MKRKILTLICSLVMMTVFAGCSLFEPDSSTDSNLPEQESSSNLPDSNDGSNSDESENGGNWTGEAPLNKGVYMQTASATGTEKFFKVQSVALRLPDEQYGEGIRFTIVMDADTYAEENVANLTTGILLIPNYALGSEELVIDSENTAMRKVDGISWTADESVMKMYVYLYNIPYTEYATDVSIRAYVDDGDATTTPLYTDVVVSSVAKAADWLYENDNLTDDEKSTLQANYLTYDVFFHDGDNVTETKGVYGEKISAPSVSKVGYTFGGWWNKEQTAEWDFNNTTIGGVKTNLYAKWVANTDTAYVVKHFQQNIDNNEYTEVAADVENKTGTTEAQTAAEAKTYTGFTAKAFEQKTIAADGSTVVEIYYDRNTYTVTFVANGGSAVENMENVKYGATVQAPVSTKQGYVLTWDYDFANPITDNTTVTASWAPATDTPWKVELYLETLTGYAETATQTFNETGTTEATATVDEAWMASKELSIPTGYELDYDKSQFTGTINADGSTVLKVYVKLKTFAVTFKGANGETLQTETLKYGAMPVYKGSIPEKASDEYYNYIFAWDKDIVSVTDETVYNGKFVAEIRPELRANTYTLNELGLADGTMGSWSDKSVVLKNTMEGKLIFKRSNTSSASQVNYIKLFGYTWTFAINSYEVTWGDGTNSSIQNIQPSTEYYYVIGYKVAEDYSNIYVSLRIENVETGKVEANVVHDYTAGLEGVTIQQQVETNGTFIMESGQVSITYASVWSEVNVETLKTVYDLNAYIADLDGTQSYETLEEQVGVYEKLSRAYQFMVNDYAALKTAYDKAYLPSSNNYTLSDLGINNGRIANGGSWTGVTGELKGEKGTIVYKWTSPNDQGNYLWITLFRGATATSDYGNGFLLTFENSTVIASPTLNTNYIVVIDYAVASDYTKVTVTVRVVKEEDGSVVLNQTQDLTTINGGGEATIEEWVKANKGFRIYSGGVTYDLSSAWTQLDVNQVKIVEKLEADIAALTGDETLEELNALKATYDELSSMVYKCMVVNSADLMAAIAAKTAA